jgi:sulfate transport system permease protein
VGSRRVAGGLGRHGLRLIAVAYIGIIVLLPVTILFWRAFKPGLGDFFDAITSHEAGQAFERTATIAVLAVLANTVFGVMAAILFARYRFWGQRLLNALIDLPVAISPIVVGLALILVYGNNGWFGFGNQVVGSTTGLVIATIFVSLPLVLRSVLPVLEEAGIEQEQAAAALGASWFTTFRRITLPTIRTALGYGVVLGLARAIGEFGAVLVVSFGFQSLETAPIYVSNLLQVDFKPDVAYAVAFVLMLISILAIVMTNLLQRRGKART